MSPLPASSANLLAVKLLSISDIPVNVSLWFIDIEKEDFVSYGKSRGRSLPNVGYLSEMS